MPSTSVATASALTGPGMIEQISAIASFILRPDLAIRDGLVVTPSIRPLAAAARNSATSAESMNSCINVSQGPDRPIDLPAQHSASGLIRYDFLDVLGKASRHYQNRIAVGDDDEVGNAQRRDLDAFRPDQVVLASHRRDRTGNGIAGGVLVGQTPEFRPGA